MRRLLNRRLFGASLLASTGVLCVQRMRTSGRISDRRRPQSRVAILDADSYARSLEEKITDGLRLFTDPQNWMQLNTDLNGTNSASNLSFPGDNNVLTNNPEAQVFLIVRYHLG
jgi:hypothetical protein